MSEISVKCKSCKKTVNGQRYHAGFSDIQALYCSDCEAALFLRGDPCEPKPPHTGNIPTSDFGREWLPFWDEFDDKLPKCKCGGSFKHMNPPRCPKCKGLIFGDIYEGRPVYKSRDFNAFDFGTTYSVKDLLESKPVLTKDQLKKIRDLQKKHK